MDGGKKAFEEEIGTNPVVKLLYIHRDRKDAFPRDRAVSIADSPFSLHCRYAEK